MIQDEDLQHIHRLSSRDLSTINYQWWIWIPFVMDWTTSISHLEKADVACQEKPLPGATLRALETPCPSVSQHHHDRRHRSSSDSPPPWAVSLESRQDITHTTFDCSLVPLFHSSCGPSRPFKLTTPAMWGAGGSMTGWSEAYYN